jgi:predicted nucleotidyltransferase
MATTNLEQIHDTLRESAKIAVSDYGAKGVYLFGSLIHKDGAQFMSSSDVDLVVVLPELADAVERWRWLQRFAEWVGAVEMRLMRVLKRSGSEPSLSVVAVTELELGYDVHKDGHREFFTANVFRDLVTDAESEGLPGAGATTIDRFVAGALSFTQKLRNDFLAVSANDTPKLGDYVGADPLPKRIMRAAAMAARAVGRSKGPGAEHDVQEGLDILTHELYARRDDEAAYRQLQDLVSVQRLARGQSRPVEPTHQLLLAELIYDITTRPEASRLKPAASDSLAGPHGSAVAPTDADAGAAPEASAMAENPARPSTSDASIERMGSSTALFADRFSAAFPGVRSISWFTERDDIEQRMLALLRDPLRFPDGLPIWYWRGGNLQIESFRRLAPGLFLMDIDELLISRVAAIHGSSYKRHFVYVRCDAMESTGLYRTSTSDRQAAIEQSGFDYEEYGLVSGETPVKRSEYDDGAAMINGRLTDLRGRSELRVRYTTPYNFLIAANGSPINNNRFDSVLVAQLNEALSSDEQEAAVVERLRELVEQLPLRGDPYF